MHIYIYIYMHIHIYIYIYIHIYIHIFESVLLEWSEWHNFGIDWFPFTSFRIYPDHRKARSVAAVPFSTGPGGDGGPAISPWPGMYFPRPGPWSTVCGKFCPLIGCWMWTWRHSLGVLNGAPASRPWKPHIWVRKLVFLTKMVKEC